MFGGRNTCLASSLKTSTAGPFFPTLITAAGNIYPGVLGSIEIKSRLNHATPFVPLALRWDMLGSMAAGCSVQTSPRGTGYRIVARRSHFGSSLCRYFGYPSMFMFNK